MAWLSSLHPGGFEVKCRARSCSSWNKSIYLSPGRLGLAAGRGVRLTPIGSHVQSGHSKEAKTKRFAPFSFSAQHQRCKDDP